MNRYIRPRGYAARAAAAIILAGVAAGLFTGTAHAETKECQATMDNVDYMLGQYEGAINSGNRNQIRFWQAASRQAIEGMDTACG